MYGTGAGTAFFCLEPEPALFGRSRSRLREFGHPEPEQPKKVAAPQHWLIQYRNCQRQIQFCVVAALSTFENNLKIAYTFFQWTILSGFQVTRLKQFRIIFVEFVKIFCKFSLRFSLYTCTRKGLQNLPVWLPIFIIYTENSESDSAYSVLNWTKDGLVPVSWS